MYLHCSCSNKVAAVLQLLNSAVEENQDCKLTKAWKTLTSLGIYKHIQIEGQIMKGLLLKEVAIISKLSIERVVFLTFFDHIESEGLLDIDLISTCLF